MKYRKLRITWSLSWGLIAILLIALWLRSYWWKERVVFGIGYTNAIQIGHVVGQVRINAFDAPDIQNFLQPIDSRWGRVQWPVDEWRASATYGKDLASSPTGFGAQIGLLNEVVFVP